MKAKKGPKASAFDTLVRILAARSHPRGELHKKLTQRGFGDGEIEEAIQRAEALHYLEPEHEIAARYARELAKKPRATPASVEQKLRQRGVPGEMASDAVAAAFEGWDPEAAAMKALAGEADPARAARKLRRWGFDAETQARAVEWVRRGDPEGR